MDIYEKLDAEAKALEAKRDWCTAHEDALTAARIAPKPTTGGLLLFCGSREQYRDGLRILMDGAKPGDIVKAGDDAWADAQRVYGDVKVTIMCRREEVCERVQTGTEKVMVPAPDAPMIEVEQPVYEWQCSSVLAGVEP